MSQDGIVRRASTRLLGTGRNPSSLMSHFRQSRIQVLLDRFPDLADMRVLDLGGLPIFWRSVGLQPKSLTIVNLFLPPVVEGIEARQHEDEVEAETIVGDASAPNLLAGEHFDLVFCNSLIEHVGGHIPRRTLAQNVYRLGGHHFVQTPYRYFPLELHWRFPVFQFLPVKARAAISRHWDGGGYTSKGRTWAEAVEKVEEVDLLSVTQMSHYFPGSEIVRERVAGITKSLIAIR